MPKTPGYLRFASSLVISTFAMQWGECFQPKADRSDKSTASALGISEQQILQIRTRLRMSELEFARFVAAKMHTLTRERSPDRPDERSKFRRLQYTVNGKMATRDELMRMRRQWNADRQKAATRPFADSAKTWASLGPDNLGGRTRSLIIDPRNPKLMWAGSVTGGVWKTENAGDSWRPLGKAWELLAVGCMAAVPDPKGIRILYVGTGEAFNGDDDDRFWWAEIHKTVNGKDWIKIALTVNIGTSVNRIAILGNGLEVLAATDFGICRLTFADPTELIVQRTQMEAGVTNKLHFADIKADPSGNGGAIAGTMSDGRIFRLAGSANQWRESTIAGKLQGSQRVEIAFAAANASIVYASITGANGAQLFRSTNGGSEFFPLATGYPEITKETPRYANLLWAGHPTDPDFVVVGGIDLWRWRGKTSDFERISDSNLIPNTAHADHHIMVGHPGFDGKTNGTVFVGNDGGIFRSFDVITVQPCLGWEPRNCGYAVTQFYGGCANSKTGTILGGSQDIGTIRFAPNQGCGEWRVVSGDGYGDGGFCASDPNDADFYFGSNPSLAIFRSDDAGDSGKLINGKYWNSQKQLHEWKAGNLTLTDARDKKAYWKAPFRLVPGGKETLLAGGESLWRTTNAKARLDDASGPAWFAIKGPRAAGNYISTIEVSPTKPGAIWVGYQNGQIAFVRSEQDLMQGNWKEIPTIDLANSSRVCNRLFADPNDPNIAYALFAGPRDDNLWRLTDEGTNWTAAAVGEPPKGLPLHCMTAHPRVRGKYYLGTEMGVYESDKGNVWTVMGFGLPVCPVNDLFWLGETLVAATFGRGMYKVDLSNP